MRIYTFLITFLRLGLKFNINSDFSFPISQFFVNLQYIIKGCSINSDFGMLLQIEVSFRLLLVFCGVFLSSFSVT